jgi:DNA-binding NtrC family response regulator
MAHVLLAERDRRIRDFIAGILAEFGHQVTMCANAFEVSKRLGAAPIDVVLTDFVLDGGQDAGFEQACEALDIPTITLTGFVFSAGQAAPAPPPLIDKPFRFADLLSVLDAVATCAAGAEARHAEIETAA